jgi:uncharacterized protein YndB with AHSA1/START domain
MAKIEESVLIDRPIEEVWRFITDISKVPKWDTHVLEAKQTSAGPLGLGATLELREKMGNINMTQLQRVIEYEPNRKFSVENTSGPVKGTIIMFSMETVEGKTRFTSSGDVRFNGFYNLVGPFVTRWLRRAVAGSVGNAKRILESE